MRLFLAVFILTTGLLCAADFRSTSWGYSPKQVEKAETTKPIASDSDQMVFQTTLGEHPVTIIYQFKNDKLTSARYQFTQQYRESEKYIGAYDALQNQLVKKYGSPSFAETRCDDVFYKDYPARWGTALVVGKLTREAAWGAGTTRLRHAAYALPGGTVAHIVEYAPAHSASEDSYQAIYGSL